MSRLKEARVLSEIRKAEPKKKRVNFFISEAAKSALAIWCKKNKVTESSAIEQMIRTTVPAQFFKEPK
ncbi:MAG: hypothetical protein JST16_06510 [Bdellovibrionales bacterium]|nr:hypothetical protein [Bdellovibrionales bacterium]